MPEENKPLDKDVEANKTLAAVGYIWILCLVPLLGKRSSKFAQFHAKQGLVLFGLELLASFFVWFQPFHALFMAALAIAAIVGIIKALNGEWYKLPYIYEWSKKINL